MGKRILIAAILFYLGWIIGMFGGFRIFLTGEDYYLGAIAYCAFLIVMLTTFFQSLPAEKETKTDLNNKIAEDKE